MKSRRFLTGHGLGFRGWIPESKGLREESCCVLTVHFTHSEVVILGWGGGHMHLVYVARQLRKWVWSRESRAGQAEKNDDIQQERRKRHTIGSLQRIISSSPR